MSFKKALTTLLIVFLFLISFRTLAYAQEQIRSITISPSTVEKSINPGEQTQGVINVTNSSSVPLTFQGSLLDFIVKDKQGTPDFLAPQTLSNRFSASSWIGIAPQTFQIAPFDKALVNYYIQIPSDARPGGRYAAVIFKPTNPIAIQGSGTSVNAQIGSLFYINVLGRIKEQAKVTRFSTKIFSETGPVTILTSIQNLGDLHIKPVGQIEVYDMLGRKLSTLPLDQKNIFPGGSERDYKNIFGQTIMLGRFKANLLASYGTNNNLPLIATSYFWVFPWRLFLVLLLLVITLVLLTLYLKNKRQFTQNPINQA
jgi:hypothetical protein